MMHGPINIRICTNVYFPSMSLLASNGLCAQSFQVVRNTQIPNFIKTRPVGAEFFSAGGRTDRLTDMAKLIVAFRNFVNAPKNRRILSTFQQYTVMVSLQNIDWLVFLIEAYCVFCEVRIESLYTM